MSELTLEQLRDRYDGVYSEWRGCYYFVDYDGDLGYFTQLLNGNFGDEVHYVDIDDIFGEDEVEEFTKLQSTTHL